MKITTLALLLLLSISLCHAKPIHLECETFNTNNSGDKLDFSVDVDEDTKKIIHTTSTGHSYETEGIYSSKTIFYNQIDEKAIITNDVIINRMTLEVEYIVKIDFKGTAENSLYKRKGTCKVIEIKDRKI